MLSQLREVYPQIESFGAGMLAVGTAADFQARRLMEDGLPFAALLDPDKNLYRTLGLGHVRWREWFRLATWRNYLRSARRVRPGRPTGGLLQTSGVTLLSVVKVLGSGGAGKPDDGPLERGRLL